MKKWDPYKKYGVLSDVDILSKFRSIPSSHTRNIPIDVGTLIGVFLIEHGGGSDEAMEVFNSDFRNLITPDDIQVYIDDYVSFMCEEADPECEEETRGYLEDFRSWFLGG